MNFSEYMGKYYPAIQPNTDVWLRYKQIWNGAEREDYVANMETYCNLVQATYQSKRDKLKKQTTHMTGKFMIVKAENNTLRVKLKTLVAKCEALIERNNELQEYAIKQEIGKFVKVIGEHPESLKPLLKIDPSKHKKVPFQC